MPRIAHRYNEHVFGSLDTASPLLQSYLRLVAIELALKNWDLANWGHGHQLDLMIAGLHRPALTALSQRLRSALVGLWCERRGGGPTPVSVTNYPALRYLRHVSDFSGSPPSSTEAELVAVLSIVNDLAAELKREGILK